MRRAAVPHDHVQLWLVDFVRRSNAGPSGFVVRRGRRELGISRDGGKWVGGVDDRGERVDPLLKGHYQDEIVRMLPKGFETNTYVCPFFVIVPKHGRAFTAEGSDTATSLLGCSVLVELQHSVILPE